jgi:2-pyrone-4,6-dicarboxylate lactonase
MTEPKASFNPNPRAPKLKLPAGACDTHFHVFGPRHKFAYAKDRSTPACDAPKETLFKLHTLLGIERGVVVQSAVHGVDNSAAADLIATKPSNYRGVALVRTDIESSELRHLDAQGFRGARFHYMAHMGAPSPIDDVLRLAAKLGRIGWHLQIHLDSKHIEQLAPALKRSPVPVVIDHMARIDASLGSEQQPFRELLRLLEDERFWVKVSGAERASRQSAPWKDAIPFARKLVAEHGDRSLWGTDWPHPNLAEVPDDGLLVDLVAEIAPSEAQRRALLVDNPQRFYGFTGREQKW